MEKIRPVKKEDLSVCSEILEGAYEEEPYGETFQKGAALKYIESRYLCGKDHSFVIELEGVIIGFVFASLSYWSDGVQAVIEEIALDKKFRGKGFSQRLNDHLEGYLKKRGVQSSMLWVKKDAPAYGFHKNNNYKEAKDIAVMFKRFKD